MVIIVIKILLVVIKLFKFKIEPSLSYPNWAKQSIKENEEKLYETGFKHVRMKKKSEI
jgi:hypothetical protein